MAYKNRFLHQKVSAITIVVLLLIVFALGYFLSQRSIQITSRNSTTYDTRTTYTLHNSCSYYGEVPKKTYLTSHIVTSGDSLLSISKSRLGDVSRVNDLVVLNNDTYPALSMSDPFVEIGWILYIPPTMVTEPLQHDLVLFSGELELPKSNRDTWWRIHTPNGISTFIPNSQTDYPDGKDVQDGDCVQSLMENTFNGRVYQISRL